MSTSTPLSPNNLREIDCERFGLQKLDPEEISALSRFGRIERLPMASICSAPETGI
jgi:hypothetical protein